MDDVDVRLFRCGLLAQHANERGHNVRWWTSGFDHYRKCFRYATDEVIEFRPGYEIECLRGCGYAKNVSLRRYRDHKILGQKFRQFAPQRARPDVIWCAVPIVELALPAVQLAREWGVPIVLDAMDRWPDHFLTVLPPAFSPAVRLLLAKQWRDTREAFAGATAVSGNSEGFVKWGLGYANRARNQWDRPFYFGYPQPEISLSTRLEANAYWDKLDVLPGRMNACFVGTVSNRPFDLTAMIRGVQQSKLSGKLVVCGEGESRPELQALAAGDPRIVFAGWRNAAEIAVLMERCHLGIAPYRPTENFLHNIPNKIPEYLAGRLAVLSGVDGEIGEILTRTGSGVVYPASDPDALAAAIDRMLQNPGALAQMKVSSGETFNQSFRASTIYPAIVDHLEKLAATHHPNR